MAALFIRRLIVVMAVTMTALTTVTVACFPYQLVGRSALQLRKKQKERLTV